MNEVILSGRLTADVELRYANNENQTPYCSFTLAVTREFDRDNADFIRCKAFGRTAEILDEYTRKGSMVIVRGRWETGSYENKDGNTVYTNDCSVDRLELVGTRSDGDGDSKKDEKKGSRDRRPRR